MHCTQKEEAEQVASEEDSQPPFPSRGSASLGGYPWTFVINFAGRNRGDRGGKEAAARGNRIWCVPLLLDLPHPRFPTLHSSPCLLEFCPVSTSIPCLKDRKLPKCGILLYRGPSVSAGYSFQDMDTEREREREGGRERGRECRR